MPGTRNLTNCVVPGHGNTDRAPHPNATSRRSQS
nr:MAG TPA: hypothetical protein [Caudoviricetes sp.]